MLSSHSPNNVEYHDNSMCYCEIDILSATTLKGGAGDSD